MKKAMKEESDKEEYFALKGNNFVLQGNNLDIKSI